MTGLAPVPPAIVFCGDFLRPDGDGRPHQRLNARWLSTVLSGLAAQFSELRVVDDSLSGVALTDLYARAWPGDPVAGWAAMQAGAELPGWIEELVERATQGALVVMFEGSPALLGLLDRLERPWIDVRTDPRRFLGDLLLTFRCSDAALEARIGQAALDPDFLAAEIAYVRGRHFYLEPELPGDALVVLAQVAVDASLIHDAAIARPGDFAEAVRASAAGRTALIKPHPYDDGASLAAWQALLPDARVIDTNFYQLISVEPRMEMLTLSSGSGEEAALFGHQVTRLLPSLPMGPAVLHAWWYPGFWRWCLGWEAGPPPATPPFVPDRLRRVINQDWSKRF